MDEAGQPEISRHFVDNPVSGRRESLNLRQIPRTEIVKIGGAHRTRHFGKILRAADLRADSFSGRFKVTELAGPVHIRMAREYLLDQRCSRAWHSHDKNWHRRRVTGVL